MIRPCVYVAASQRNGTLYVGVTSNLEERILQHKNKHSGGFTAKYDVGILVWYEFYARMEDAILREKQIKKWNRQWKIELIEKMNPRWEDLYETLNT